MTMEWQIILVAMLCMLLLLFATGLPIAFCFLALNLLGAAFILGGEGGLSQFVMLSVKSVGSWSLLPLPMFILMGEVMAHSGVLPKVIDALDEWVGHVTGRLALESVGMGALFASLSGSSVTAVATLGGTLTPEMEKRGYHKSISLGSILGAGGLAMFIPPSVVAVILASLAGISVGKVLIAIIMPGLTMATIFFIYILGRCRLQPSIAPPYEMPPTPLSRKLLNTAQYILPLAFIIFAVTGVIFLGIATATEAAATGAFSCFILAACYRKLNWEVVKKIMVGSMEATGMVFFIILSALVFTRILAFSGVTAGLIGLVEGLTIPTLAIVAVILLTMLIMGTFMDAVTILMVAVPITYPIIHALGLDPIWFGIMMMMTVEIGLISPPFGMSLFIMKGVASRDTTLADIYKASIPFCLLDVMVLILLLFFPIITLWLPSLMR